MLRVRTLGSIPGDRPVRVLSPSAVHSSLEALVEAHRASGGAPVELEFETAPAIVKRVAEGATADMLVAPPKVMQELVGMSKADPRTLVSLGRTGVGICVRAGTPAPDVSTTAALTRSLLEADAIYHTRASSGIYVAQLLERLGVAAQRKNRIRSYHDAQQTFSRMLESAGSDIGFGGIPEIRRWSARGLKYVAALPEDIQNYTTYLAALAIEAANPDGARAFLALLGSPAARAIFEENGVMAAG